MRLSENNHKRNRQPDFEYEDEDIYDLEDEDDYESDKDENEYEDDYEDGYENEDSNEYGEMCMHLGVPADERIAEICLYSCEFQSECPYYGSAADDYNEDDN